MYKYTCVFVITRITRIVKYIRNLDNLGRCQPSFGLFTIALFWSCLVSRVLVCFFTAFLDIISETQKKMWSDFLCKFLTFGLDDKK